KAEPFRTSPWHSHNKKALRLSIPLMKRLFVSLLGGTFVTIALASLGLFLNQEPVKFPILLEVVVHLLLWPLWFYWRYVFNVTDETELPIAPYWALFVAIGLNILLYSSLIFVVLNWHNKRIRETL
ncbi:MAG TPA: hypothetical protein VEF04_18720, partial [Blastocatellia bacterium]|nr:hypothetical protein [Blastocatellia bacterium]